MNKYVCHSYPYLCHRCGACVSVCPVGVLTLDSRGYPEESSGCTDCGICGEICTGAGIDLPRFTKELFDKPYDFTNGLGIFDRAYVGYAADPTIRSLGASGGIITALLLHLLEREKVEGAIVVTYDEKHPSRAKAILARTPEQILLSAQSKYSVVPVASILHEVKRYRGPFVMVGLPCHIHAYRRLAEVDNALRGRILLAIGLYCGGTMEPEGTTAILRNMKTLPGMVKKLEYRGGDWPGRFRVRLADGDMHSVDLDILRYFRKLYWPVRCSYCIDYSSELSDMSVADAWTRQGDKWKYPGGQSIVLQRTKIARDILDGAREQNAIVVEEIERDIVLRTHQDSLDIRKTGSIIHIENLKSKNGVVPDYGDIEFPQISDRRRRKERISTSARVMGRYALTRRAIEAIAFALLRRPEALKSGRKSGITSKLWGRLNVWMNWWFRW